jgi:hypothetical protein
MLCRPQGTELALAQCSTIRTKVLKFGAHVSFSIRMVRVRCASGYPYQRIFAVILANLRAHYVPLRFSSQVPSLAKAGASRSRRRHARVRVLDLCRQIISLLMNILT